jgi:hypothetical protein
LQSGFTGQTVIFAKQTLQLNRNRSLGLNRFGLGFTSLTAHRSFGEKTLIAKALHREAQSAEPCSDPKEHVFAPKITVLREAVRDSLNRRRGDWERNRVDFHSHKHSRD